MKRIASFLLSFLILANVALGDAVIFNGNFVKALRDKVNLFDTAYILTGTADPTSSATSAPKGSLYLRQTAAGNGAAYIKFDNGSSTNWGLIGAGVGVGDVLGPASSTDNAIVRFDSTTGKLIQNSVGILSDAGALSGLTQLNVDNIRIDGNVISTQDVNGTMNLNPNGGGSIIAGVAANTTPNGTGYGFIGGGNNNTVNGANYGAIVGGQSNLVDATQGFVAGGQNNSALGNSSAVIAGRYNTSQHASSLALGNGAMTAVADDFVIGNNSGAASSSLDNNHFQVDGDDSEVHIGRATNQSSVVGASNTLKLHTTNASNQSNYIGHQAASGLTSSATYTWPTPTASKYLSTDGSGVLSWGTPGDVAGPGSSTDNAVARFDSTTGKIIQNSGVIISDANAVTGMTSLDVDELFFNDGTIQADSNLTLSPGGGGEIFTASRFVMFNNPGIRLFDADSSVRIDILTPAVLGSQWSLTLPDNDGDNLQFLQTNGSGTTSWVAAVKGPASAVDNTLVRFDSTTGSLVQTSDAVLSDAEQLSGLRNIIAAPSTDVIGLSISQGNAANTEAVVSLTNSSTAAVPSILIENSGSGASGIDVNVLGARAVRAENTSATLPPLSLINLSTGPIMELFEPTTAAQVLKVFVPSLSADWSLTLPADDGAANQVLTTNGSGVTSWASALTSGTNTPTATNGANVSAVGTYAATYSQVGSIVTVAGRVDVNCTTGSGTASAFSLTLPIASNLGSGIDANGVFTRVAASSPNEGGIVEGDATNDKALFSFYCVSTGNRQVNYTYQYRII